MLERRGGSIILYCLVYSVVKNRCCGVVYAIRDNKSEITSAKRENREMTALKRNCHTSCEGVGGKCIVTTVTKSAYTRGLE